MTATAPSTSTKTLHVTRAERDLAFQALIHFVDTGCSTDRQVLDGLIDKLYATEVDLYEAWDCQEPNGLDLAADELTWPLPVSYASTAGGQA